MATYTALLRGVNVVGKNRLPMQELVRLLAAAGCAAVRTYIQSGNAVFQSETEARDELAGRIGLRIRERFGFEPAILLLETRDLERIVASNPFPVEDGGKLHCFFALDRCPAPDLGMLEEVSQGSDGLAWRDGVLFFHAPEGFGTSRVPAKVDRCLGVPTTARNWNTVLRLLQMARETGG